MVYENQSKIIEKCIFFLNFNYLFLTFLDRNLIERYGGKYIIKQNDFSQEVIKSLPLPLPEIWILKTKRNKTKKYFQFQLR